MYKKFVNDKNPRNVVSYIDYSHTTLDTFLTTLGFEEKRPTGSGIQWWNKDKVFVWIRTSEHPF